MSTDNKTWKSYKELSITNWGRNLSEDENPNRDDLKLGCLLRMADSMEAMAKNHVKLQDDYNYMKERRDYWQSEAESLQRKIRSMKGVITKLKKSKP